MALLTPAKILPNNPPGCCPARSNNAERAGVILRALKVEMTIEKAMVRANWRYSCPVVPGKKATGINTAKSTKEVATTAPDNSFIASMAAKWGRMPCSCTFPAISSTTTMASSTTIPVARVSPNRVRLLMEKPKILIKAKVPIREMGITMVGTKVARQFCRKTNSTNTTNATACMRVLTTSRPDSTTNKVGS